MVLLTLVAAGQAAALEVTLEQCADLAVKNNSGLKAFAMDMVSAGEEVSIAKKGFLPSLKLNGNYFLVDKTPRLIIEQNVLSPGIPPRNTEIPTGDSSWYALNLSLEQPLFTGGKLTHSYLKSKALNEEALHRVERRRRELVLEVRQSFFAALNARLYTEIVEKALEAKKERLRVLQELLAEGYASREEILQQETDIQFTDLELYKGKNREALGLSRLKQLIQAPDDEELRLQGSPTNGILTASLDEVKGAATTNREDLKAARAQGQAADEDVAITKSGFYPHAALQGSFIQQKETNISRPQVWLLAAQLEWPLFEWGKTRAELRQKAAQKQKVSYESEELRKDVLLEVERIWRTVKEREKAVKAQEKRVKTSEYRLNLATEKYAEEKVKLSDVIAMEAEFIKDCNEYSMAINDANGEFARIEASTSSLLGPWIKGEEIYHPDFDAHSKKLQELLKKKRKTKVEGGADDNVAVNSLPETTAGSGAEAAAPQARDAGRRAPRPRAVSCSPVEVQVAAFKTRKQAELCRRALAKSSGEREVRIVSNGGFHKVRIKGFCANAEVEETMKSSGIKEYLIVKASHGH